MELGSCNYFVHTPLKPNEGQLSNSIDRNDHPSIHTGWGNRLNLDSTATLVRYQLARKKCKRMTLLAASYSKLGGIQSRKKNTPEIQKTKSKQKQAPLRTLHKDKQSLPERGMAGVSVLYAHIFQPASASYLG